MPKGARAPTAKGMVLAQDRESLALDLRKSGMNYENIAKNLGMSLEGSRQCVIRALAKLKEVCAEKAEEVRQLESERLDALTQGLWEKAVTGDVAATTACLRVMERRSKLLGVDLVQADGTQSAALEALVATLAKKDDAID